MQVTKITLEDNGQDVRELYVSEAGEVVDIKPYRSPFWNGATIRIDMVAVGDSCGVHGLPHIACAWLKYKVEKIEKVEHECQTK